jgi:hypothetical protein
MQVKIYYQDKDSTGRVSVFDTDKFCTPEPAKNLNIVTIMTEFIMRYDMMMRGEGLACDIWFYNALPSDAHGNQKPSVKDDLSDLDNIVPADRRLYTRVYLILPDQHDTKDENGNLVKGKRRLDNVWKITQDDELIAWRQNGEMVSGIQFFNDALLNYKDANTSSINQQIATLYEWHKNTDCKGLSDATIAHRMGIKEDTLAVVRHYEGEDAKAHANTSDELGEGVKDDPATSIGAANHPDMSVMMKDKVTQVVANPPASIINPFDVPNAGVDENTEEKGSDDISSMSAGFANAAAASASVKSSHASILAIEKETIAEQDDIDDEDEEDDE